MRFQLILAVIGPLLAPRATLLAQDVDRGRTAFVEWGNQSLHPLVGVKPMATTADLAPLAAMIGNARMVAVSEAVHAGAEPLEFRNRVFQYLVEHHGFTAIALESGLPESHGVHDWVRGGAGDLASTLKQGLTWTFDRLPQNAALIQWIRDYNADPTHAKKINFYGFDVPGSPGNPQANRPIRSAVEEVFSYLARVDPDAAATFHGRLDALLPNMHLDPSKTDVPQYTRLSQAERDMLTGGVADLISLLERREARYTSASSASDYQWAYRSAIGARASDLWLRQIPVGWQPSGGMSFFSEATDIRDRAQADNLSWIMDREGPDGKIVVFASRYHISTSPVKTSMSGPHGNAVAGTYLRPRFGNQLVTIGNFIRAGTWGCTGFSADLAEPSPQSFDRIAGEMGKPLYLLDLRKAPGPVRSWLDRDHEIGEGQGAWHVNIARAFDILFYLDRVSAACPK